MSMNNGGGTWPEQDLVHAWLDKHGIEVTYLQAMELKEALTAPRILADARRQTLIRLIRELFAWLLRREVPNRAIPELKVIYDMFVKRGWK